jgi:hypothetical protein
MTMLDWMTLGYRVLVAVAICALFFLKVIFPTRADVDDKISKALKGSDESMTAQHALIVQGFETKIVPLVSLPSRVATLETQIAPLLEVPPVVKAIAPKVDGLETFEADTKQTLSEAKATLSAHTDILARVAADVKALDTGQGYIRENQKRVMDVLDDIRRDQVRHDKTGGK